MTDHTRRTLLLAAAGTATGLSTLAPRARAQAAPWPSKQIRLIVAFPPGGLTDAYARMFAEQVTAKYGQPVVVDNRPGAGGNIAIQEMLKAPADGYTLLCTTSGTLWQNRVLYRKLPFDLAKDIAPITLYPSGALVLAVAEKVPARNFNELVEYARKNPCSMGSYAPAAHPHMLAEALNRDHGTKIQTIVYKGEAPMWVDVASGQVEMAVGSYQAFANVQAKGVRPIGVTGSLRCPKLPDIGTLSELGMKGEVPRLDGGLPVVAQTGTPEDILDKLAQVAVDGSETQRAKSLRESFAIPDKPKTRAETLRVWREIAPVWIRQAEALGVKLD
jgi:tripartite-type tricarboxylate transporter receptor subunit TctC